MVTPNTRFREFDNKSSLAKRHSRMLNGGRTETKGNKLGWWERRDILKDTITDRVFVLKPEHEGRPDLVASSVYGTSRLTWLVLQYNNIVDIEEEFLAGNTIMLPSRTRVFSKIAVQNPQNQE